MANPAWEDTDPVQRSPAQAGAPSWEDTSDPEDVYGGTSGELKAFGAGAARGATFGLSDQALVHSGLVNSTTLSGLQSQNPIASGAGELTGIVAPALLGEEAGLANLPGTVSKLGRITEGSAALTGAGKITAKALGYGAEGAAYGLGQSVSENALGDHDLVSEKTLANIGLSAAFMGGIGGLVGKFGKVAGDASSAADKFEAQKIANDALPGSDEAVISQTDLPAEDKLSFIKNFKSQKPGAEGMRKEFAEAGLPEVLGMMSNSETVQKMASAISQLPTMAGDAVRKDVNAGFQKVNNVLKDSFNVVPGEMMDREAGGASIKEMIKDKFNTMMDPLKARYAEREALGQQIKLPDDEVLKFYDSLTDAASKYKNVTNEGREVITKAAQDVMEEAAHQSGTSGTSAISNLDSLAKSLGQKGSAAFRAGNHDVSQAYSMVREKIENFINEQMEAAEKELGDKSGNAADAAFDYKDLKDKYKNFKNTFTDFAKTTGIGKRSTTKLGLSEALDKVPNEQFVDKIFDPKNAKGLQNIKENFPDVFTALSAQKKSQMYQNAMVNKTFNPLQLMKEINNEQKLSKGVKNLLFSPEQLQKMQTAEKWIKNLPAKVGPSGTPEGLEYMEMAKNPIKSLIGHGINEAGSAVSKKLIESLTSPGEEAALKSLINLDKAQEKVNKGIGIRIKSLFDKTAVPVTGKVVSKIVSSEDFHEKADQIREDANNPIKTMDKLGNQTDELYAHAPNVTNSLKMGFIRGTQFLNSKLPTQDPDLFGDKPEVSPAQISQFERYYNVVENPLVALEQVKDGTITPETVQAMQAVYPKLYSEMSQKMMDGIVGLKDKSKISYQTKQAMSMFLGQPLDASLKAQSVAQNQAIFAPINAAHDAQTTAKPSKAGMAKITLANRVGINPGSNLDA